MTITVKELTTYDISDDGTSVDVNLVDDTGERTRLTFRLSDLGNLLMTLPSLIEAALRRQRRDGSYRFAHPVGGWTVEETADPASVIISINTKDGFGVRFLLRRTDASQLASSLADVYPRALSSALH